MILEYGERFMRDIDYVRKIFIPINEDNMHWFLMMVDFIKMEIVLLDSFPDQNGASLRLKKSQKSGFLEDMILYLYFWDLQIPQHIRYLNLTLYSQTVYQPKGLTQMIVEFMWLPG